MSVPTRQLAWFALGVATVLAVGAAVGVVFALAAGRAASTVLWAAALAVLWAGIGARLALTVRRDAKARGGH